MTEVYGLLKHVDNRPFILGIHTTVSERGIAYPPPDLHVYMSGILARRIDIGYQTWSMRWVVDKPIEYLGKTGIYNRERVANTAGLAVLPNHIRYFIAAVNAEQKAVELTESSKIDGNALKEAVMLYNIAAFYKKRYGSQAITSLLEKTVFTLGYCIEVMRAFHNMYGYTVPEIEEGSVLDFEQAFLKREKERRELEDIFLE